MPFLLPNQQRQSTEYTDKWSIKQYLSPSVVNNNNKNRFTALCHTTQVSQYQKKNSPLTPILITKHSLSASSIYYNPQHSPCSIYVLFSLFAPPLSRSSVVYLTHTHTHTHTHTFNSLFSRTTWVSRHQKGKPFWILLKQDMMGWQWHQLDHVQIICTTLQTDNHTSSTHHSIFLRAGCSS